MSLEFFYVRGTNVRWAVVFRSTRVWLESVECPQPTVSKSVSEITPKLAKVLAELA
jgi:hypothetical protein